MFRAGPRTCPPALPGPVQGQLLFRIPDGDADRFSGRQCRVEAAGGKKILKNDRLLKINFNITLVLVIGFTLTAILSYRANYQASLDNIEQVSSLTAEGIYYRLTTKFTKPVNISLTMSHDNLLARHLSEEKEHLKDKAYTETTRDYLETYREKYGFASVFLVSTATRRYYTFQGIDRILNRDNPENAWYFRLMDSPQDYALHVDNDEVCGADNEITVFVNCKIKNPDGKVLGIVGVGIRIDSLKELLRGYEEKYHVTASLISESGEVEISTSHSGYEKKDWFELHHQEDIRRELLNWREDASSLELWTPSAPQSGEKSFIVARYIPELSWYLIVAQNTGLLIREMQTQLYQTCAVLVAVILGVLLIITTVIRNFNRQITQLMEERQALFQKATEQQYDNICEFNITGNRPEGRRTEEYFARHGAGGLPYDQGMRILAEKYILKEHQAEFLAIFASRNVLREYEAGNNHLRYEFMMRRDETPCSWMRIDAHIFYSAEDASVHMFTYRKNIDGEKKNEWRAVTDEMTGFYTRKAGERIIDGMLSEKPDAGYAFFILDIDNFKQANDRFGHVFGDHCIRTFTAIIRRHFTDKAVLGRIGGDEFMAFAPSPDRKWAEARAGALSEALRTVCTDGTARWDMSASIGVALAPQDGTDFNSLYQNADAALYQTKKKGKNGFSMYDGRKDGPH